MFDVLSIPMDLTRHDGIPFIRIEPDDFFPIILDRIEQVLAGATPFELMALPERGGTARAEQLLANARRLPPTAWADARLARDDLYPELVLPTDYRRRQAYVESLVVLGVPDDTRRRVVRLAQRADALEVALGWFLHALRLAVGGYRCHIGPFTDGDPKPWRL